MSWRNCFFSTYDWFNKQLIVFLSDQHCIREYCVYCNKQYGSCSFSIWSKILSRRKKRDSYCYYNNLLSLISTIVCMYYFVLFFFLSLPGVPYAIGAIVILNYHICLNLMSKLSFSVNRKLSVGLHIMYFTFQKSYLFCPRNSFWLLVMDGKEINFELVTFGCQMLCIEGHYQ